VIFELSLIIPTYNEDKNLEMLVDKIVNSIQIKKKYYQIIVVDDNSTDDTPAILKKLKKKYNQFSFYVRKNEIRDLSKSCILGFTKSRFENVLVMDADLQHNPRYINKFTKIFFQNNCDIVVGCRNFKKIIKIDYLSSFRYFLSLVIITFYNKLLGFRSSDPMSGFFLFKKKLFTKYKKDFFSKGYKILLDFLYNCNNDLKIVDIQIIFDQRVENSSKINMKVLFYIIEFLFVKILKNFFFISFLKKPN
jgi:dolichol-phosphate mannosyltransferase